MLGGAKVGVLRDSHNLFTREYTQCTAGYTFCFVVVVGGVVVVVVTIRRPLIKLGTISADS
jgi:hypothetical protein